MGADMDGLNYLADAVRENKGIKELIMDGHSNYFENGERFITRLSDFVNFKINFCL